MPECDPSAAQVVESPAPGLEAQPAADSAALLAQLSDVVREVVPPEAVAVADPKARRESWLLTPPAWLTNREVQAAVSQYIDIGLRLIMALFFTSLGGCWLNKVGETLNAQTKEKTLDSSVLIALITTTTLNVLGLSYFVANYLFPKVSPGGGLPVPSTPPEPPTKPS